MHMGSALYLHNQRETTLCPDGADNFVCEIVFHSYMVVLERDSQMYANMVAYHIVEQKQCCLQLHQKPRAGLRWPLVWPTRTFLVA